MNKMKPVTLVSTNYPRYHQNTAQQAMLLNALKITSDPKKLKDMIGVRTVAEVYRTLDKMALRKEYHKSLEKLGIDFEYILRGLKIEAECADKSADKIKVYQILLKSLGMDKYESKEEGGGGGWEDAIMKKIEEEKKSIVDSKDINMIENDAIETYEVTAPEVPDSVKKSRELEISEGRALYG